MRPLFVGDRIPPQLRRVVEFLNRQMQPAEVLAVEHRQYEGQGLKTLVPIVLGQTQDSVQKKGGGASRSKETRTWDEVFVSADVAAKASPAALDAARAKADGSGAGQIGSPSTRTRPGLHGRRVREGRGRNHGSPSALGRLCRRRRRRRQPELAGRYRPDPRGVARLRAAGRDPS